MMNLLPNFPSPLDYAPCVPVLNVRVRVLRSSTNPLVRVRKASLKKTNFLRRRRLPRHNKRRALPCRSRSATREPREPPPASHPRHSLQTVANSWRRAPTVQRNRRSPKSYAREVDKKIKVVVRRCWGLSSNTHPPCKPPRWRCVFSRRRRAIRSSRAVAACTGPRRRVFEHTARGRQCATGPRWVARRPASGGVCPRWCRRGSRSNTSTRSNDNVADSVCSSAPPLDPPPPPPLPRRSPSRPPRSRAPPLARAGARAPRALASPSSAWAPAAASWWTDSSLRASSHWLNTGPSTLTLCPYRARTPPTAGVCRRPGWTSPTRRAATTRCRRRAASWRAAQGASRPRSS